MAGVNRSTHAAFPQVINGPDLDRRAVLYARVSTFFPLSTFANSYTYDAASNSDFGSLVDSTGVRTADRTGLAAPDGRTTTYSGARP